MAIGDDNGHTSLSGNGAEQYYGNSSTSGDMSPQIGLIQGSFNKPCIGLPADANIGSIMGIGFPAWTGGILQYINGYEGGLPGFVARAEELAATYGERFTPPALLVAKAEKGERFTD